MQAILFPAVVLLALCACVQQPPPRASAPSAVDLERTFLALDSDRNGVLTRAEADDSPLLARRFARADANGDGLLVRYEYNAPAWRPFRGEPD